MNARLIRIKFVRIGIVSGAKSSKNTILVGNGFIIFFGKKLNSIFTFQQSIKEYKSYSEF